MSIETFQVVLKNSVLYRGCNTSTGMMSLDQATIEPLLSSAESAVERVIDAYVDLKSHEIETERERVLSLVSNPDQYLNGLYSVNLDAYFYAIDRITQPMQAKSLNLSKAEVDLLTLGASTVKQELKGYSSWRLKAKELARSVEQVKSLQEKLLPFSYRYMKFLHHSELGPIEARGLGSGLRYLDMLIESVDLEKPTDNSKEIVEPQTLAEKFNVERRLPAFLIYANAKSQLSFEERIAVYKEEKQEFMKTLKLLPEEYRRKLSRLLESTRNVDWADIAPTITKVFRSRGKLDILDYDLELTYNANQSKDDPEFANMRKANHFLLSNSESPSVERLLKVHNISMANGVDDLPSNELGRIRNHPVLGEETTKGLTQIEVKRINKNPYLSFQVNNRYSRRSEKTGRIYGDIVYPEPLTVKEVALQRIALSHPKVFKAVADFQNQPIAIKTEQAEEQTLEYLNLTQRLVTALLEQVYNYYEKQRSELGELDTSKKFIKFVHLVALQEREAMSVHPLPDGNGRSIRQEVLYDLFDKSGISRPRLTDPNKDFLLSPSGWCQQVEKGILSTDALYRDIQERIQVGLRIENSPELFTPDLPRSIGIHIKTRENSKVERNVTQMPLVKAEYSAYVDARFTLDAALLRRYKASPVEVMSDLRKEYKALAKKSFVFAHVQAKQKFDLVGLHLVDFDFRETIGVAFSNNTEAWNHKMNRWYNKSLAWRGMSDTEEVSEQLILDKFTKFSWLGLSNNLLEYWGESQRDHEKIKKLLHKEFEKYNQGVVQGTLKDVVNDHINEGEGYEESFGFSTSKRKEIGEGFAWGRGTYGYTDKEVRAAQPDIKSRILIGGYLAVKDVDVSRLRFVDPEFRYNKAQQQQEVLGIGAWDPDAIMVLQTIDSKRKAIKSWVRNPRQPNEVWVIKGDCDFDNLELDDLSKELILDKIKLTY